MTLETFARDYRLKIRRDECGDPIIPGHRGESQLYFDAGELCLMVLNGPVALRTRWEALGGKLWLGDYSPLHDDGTGPRVQDVKITGTPLANAKLAIRMARIKPKRVMSEAQRLHAEQALRKAHADE